MESLLKLYEKPGLKNPRLVTAWGCIGEVGIRAITYLRERLGAKELGRIEPYDFFDVPLLVADGLGQELKFPQSTFYFWQNNKGDDLIILVADREPSQGRYEYATLILDLAQQFEVKSIYTACAFPASLHHSEEPRVWGVVNNAELLEYLKEHKVMLLGEGNLTSMNALLLAIARDRGIDGIYLLGEVPSYATGMANPKSSRAVLKVLVAMLGLTIDLGGIEESVLRAEQEIDQMVKQASQAFLRDFTIDYRDFFKREAP